MPRRKKRMGVDPGTQKLGWAVGPMEVALKGPSRPRVAAWGGAKESNGDWLDRIPELLLELDIIFGDNDPDEVIIEMPRVFGAGKGIGAQASGSILKLMFFVGRLVEVAQRSGETGARVGLLEAGIWQGNLSKPIVYNRMARHYKLDFPSDEQHWDISDAIGLLHYSHEEEKKIRWLR